MMTDGLFGRNYQAAKKTIVGWKYDNEQEVLEKYEGRLNETEFVLTTEKNQLRLQSNVDMELATDVWCEQFEDNDVTYMSIFVIYGLGYYRYIEKLIERYPESVMLVYEPDEKIIINQMNRYDMANLLENEKLYVFTGERRHEEWRRYIGSIITFANYQNLIYGILPNYIKADENEYILFKETIEYFISNAIEETRLMVNAEKLRGRNFLHNLYDNIYNAGIRELRGTFSKYKLDSYPAIIVSAGPSLEHNVRELIKYKGKAFIIGVNASLKVMLRYDIVPDIMLSYDAKISDMTPFDDELINRVPLLTGITSDYRVVDKNNARRFYTYESNGYINYIAKSVGTKLELVSNGGCVANAAFGFAHAIGFRTIILVGQDLAYTNNRIHAGEREDNNQINTDDRAYVMVKGVCEELVPTDRIMCSYRKWFEDRIQDFPELNVINATEGGAYIEGAEHMRLKDALKKYCSTETLQFDKIINECEYAFNEEQRKQALEIMNQSRQNIDNIKKVILSRKKVYERIDKLNRKHKYKTAEFKKCVKEAGEIEKYIQDNPEMELIKQFVNRTEANVQNKMRKQEDIYGEVKLLAESGIELLDGYAEACDKLKEMWDEVLKMNEERP